MSLFGCHLAIFGLPCYLPPPPRKSSLDELTQNSGLRFIRIICQFWQYSARRLSVAQCGRHPRSSRCRRFVFAVALEKLDSFCHAMLANLFSQHGPSVLRKVRFANGRPNVRVVIENALEWGMLRVAEHDAQTAHGG